MQQADWNNTTIVDGDVAARLNELQETVEGDITISGSATLVRWLLADVLLDRPNLVGGFWSDHLWTERAVARVRRPAGDTTSFRVCIGACGSQALVRPAANTAAGRHTSVLIEDVGALLDADRADA